MRGRLAISCLMLATTILFPAYLTASVELSIGAVSVDTTGGSFVVRASTEEPVLIGAYSVWARRRCVDVHSRRTTHWGRLRPAPELAEVPCGAF